VFLVAARGGAALAATRRTAIRRALGRAPGINVHAALLISTTVDSLPCLIDACQYVGVRLIREINEECCPPILRAPLEQEESERLAAALRVLADPARLRLLSILSASPGGEACVCNLTEPLGLSQPTVSHHMRVLSEAGLIEREQRGRWAFYRLRPERLNLLRGALDGPSAVSPDAASVK
jgi:ArsR family transcriptional regulator